MKLWLVRHGETASNAGGVFQGHIDIALNEVGEAQAKSVGRHLADVDFDAIFASDLQRAARTALLIAGERPVTLDADLREMNYGILQGVAYADAADVLRPHGLDAAWINGDVQRGRHVLPEGESLRQFRYRAARFVDRIDRDYSEVADANILIVGHGGLLAILTTVLLGLPAKTRNNFRFANCGVTVLTRTRAVTTLDRHNIILWNDGQPFTDRGLPGQLSQRGE
ncbi:MAG: histidine phosphatase family protein [Thermomicrobiales bacterium]|nr:histidine phosphatase family protein [Thermomicrobiales bacterium]